MKIWLKFIELECVTLQRNEKAKNNSERLDPIYCNNFDDERTIYCEKVTGHKRPEERAKVTTR